MVAFLARCWIEQDPLHGDYAFVGLERHEKGRMLFAGVGRANDATRSKADLEADRVDRARTQVAFSRGACDRHGGIPSVQGELPARRFGRASDRLAAGVTIDFAAVERGPYGFLAETGPTFDQDGLLAGGDLERRIAVVVGWAANHAIRSEEHTSELQSLMRIS